MKLPNRMVLWTLITVAAVGAARTADAQVRLGGASSAIDLGRIYINPAWLLPTWKCVHADGRACATQELANPWYKQVVILSAGFSDNDHGLFLDELDRTVKLMTTAGSAWTTQKKDRLLFVGYFTGGGALGTPTAAFGAKIAQHPVRGYATSLSNDAVYAKINAIRAQDIAQLQPFTVGVLFNSLQDNVTANASPPSFVGKPFGVGKFTRQDLNSRGAYVPAHELAHAGLNFLDEYVERGFQDLNIRQIDALTPLILFDWTWGGFVDAISDLLSVYDYNVSEILANNGNDNISLSRYPSTVGWSEDYAYEGGMFFGRGTWHMAGNNLMNGNFVMRAPDDGFDFAHSGSQQRVIETAFGAGPRRANDRLRNAGPKNGWPLSFGSSTHVMLFDADKLNHFQPTRSYQVQVGWYDRQWHTCWYGPAPYPCYDDVWTTAENTVWPSQRSVDVKLTSAYGLANLAQGVMCWAGINEVATGGGSFRLCDTDLTTTADNFLPTIKFPLPYQDVTVPASQWMTTYWWRFKTNNGTYDSGYTGWSSFYRSL